MLGLEQADYPEEHVDVGEEENVGEEKRVAGAPLPEKTARFGGIVAEEREEEDDGRERDEDSDEGILQIFHSIEGDGDGRELDRKNASDSPGSHKVSVFSYGRSISLYILFER